MPQINCPLKGCPGYFTTSGRGNVVNHLKEMAKSELLTKYILGEGSLIHAEYLKKNTRSEQITIYRVGKVTFTLKGNEVSHSKEGGKE